MATSYRCKVPDNRLLSPRPAQHAFIYIDVQHSELAERLLIDLGLAVRVEDHVDLIDHDDFRHLHYIDKSLQAKRYVPPTSGQDGVISPVFARLVICNPNSDNAQVR